MGRDRELERVQAALDHLAGGRGGVVLVSGEPGIGKTRLVEELAGLAAEQGAAVAWGRVDESAGAPPYWPWVQVLEGVLAGVGPKVGGAALEPNAGPIAAILPSVAELVGDVPAPPPLDATAARFRLHECIGDLVRRVAGHGPLVLILEDLHWADVSSLELTRFVAAGLGDTRVLLVITYRDVDAGDSQPFEDLLGSLARAPGLERIGLGGLSEAEVGQFLAQTIGLRSPAAVVATVHARTEGNPFFVGELARLLHSEGMLGAAGAGGEHAVPAGVRDVVRRRLGRLPKPSYELLMLAAVLGREFDVAVLATAAALSTPELLDGIEPALAAGVIAEAAGGLRFSHALIRDTVYGELSALRRATLHGRVGAAIEQRHGSAGPRVAELAWHFFHAAPVVGPERGLGLAIEAAAAAQAALAYERAEDDLRRALRLIGLLPAGRDRLRRDIEVQNQLAMLLTTTRGYATPETAEAWTRSRELYAELGSARELLMPLYGLFLVHTTRGDHPTATGIGEELLKLGEAAEDPALVLAGHQVLGVSTFYRGRLGEARQHLERAGTLAHGFDDVSLLEMFPIHPGVEAIQLAIVYHLTGNETRCEGVRAEARVVCDRLEQPTSVAAGLVLDLCLQGSRGALDTLPEDAARTSEFCRKYRLLELAAVADFWGASARQFRDGGDHVSELTAALLTLEKSGLHGLRTQYLAVLAQAHTQVGRADQALAQVEQGLVEAGRNDERFWEPELLRLRAELLVAGDPARLPQAVESATAALGLARARKDR